MAEIVKLNVGGNVYTTSRSTLTKYPDSMLGTMFSERLPTTKDEHGNYWIDGNGDMFRYVLDFLRRGRLIVPQDFQDLELLESEADWYQIPELTEAVKAKRLEKTGGKESKDEYIVVRIEERKRYSSILDIFGSDHALQQLDKIFSSVGFDCGLDNSYRIHAYNYLEGDFPVVAVKALILNIGFEVCNKVNVDDDKKFYDAVKNEGDTYHVMWFIKKGQ